MNEVSDFCVSIFEKMKKKNEHGTEYWLARELCKELKYSSWQKFGNVIKKAKQACGRSGFDVNEHFIEINRKVSIGSKMNRNISDIQLSRFACYLIVQNGDPRNEIIALCKSYFAILTRKQEIQDNLKITELAVRLFQSTQLEEKIIREGIKGQEEINQAHEEVRKKVRQAINELGSNLPEELPPPQKP
jgi:hypothetical protein